MALIKLTKGKFAVVDDEDFDRLNVYKWHCVSFYAGRTPWKSKTKYILMHREILTPPKDMLVDHINGNGLDNRKSNLRLATKADNQMNQKISTKNTSGHRGIAWRVNRGVWRVRIQKNYKIVFSKSFVDFQYAISARDKAIIELDLKFYRK